MAANEKLGGQFRHHQRLNPTGKGADQYDYVRPGVEKVWNYKTEDLDEKPVLHSHLSMTVDQTPPKSAFAYPDMPTTVTRDEPLKDWEDDKPSAVDMDRMRAAEKDLAAPHPDNPDQGKLFGMVSTPGRSEVNYMVGTKAGRAHAMTMIGMAQIHNIQTHGRSLLPSTDLSEHSHKLATHLAEKGASPAPIVPVGNMMDFRTTGIPYRNVLAQGVPEAQARQGRNFVRHVVRGGASDPRGTGPAGSAMDKLSVHQWRQQREGRQPRRTKVNPDQGTLF